MPDIEIDTHQLASPVFAIHGVSNSIDGSTSPVRISLLAGSGYRLELGNRVVGNFEFAIKDDGTIDYDESRCRLTSVLGDGPAILARQVRQ